MGRVAVNFKIQGSSADVFKMAMIRVYGLLKESRSRIIMPVHDEIITYFHRDDFHLIPEVKRRMEDFKFNVSLPVSIKYSASTWADKESLHI